MPPKTKKAPAKKAAAKKATAAAKSTTEEQPVTGPPSVEDVAAQLDRKVTDLRELYSAEKAAQASLCHVPSARAQWPDELAQALVRRVEVALSSGPRSGSNDSEVRRLEADHRKRVAGP